MKECSKCKKTKELTDFYRNQKSKDGRSSYCKDCDRLFCRRARANNLEAHRAVDRAYYARHRERIRARHRRNRELFPEKASANLKVKQALETRDLVKQACEVCGDVKSEAHHDDYSKPLDVRWLCHKHHMRVHWGKGD